MLKKLISNKILLSIIGVSFIIIGTLFVYIPKVTEQNTIDTVIRNAQNAVAQIKLTRGYYVSDVVGDVKKYAKGQLSFGYNHQGKNGILPFPTTTIHDLSKIFSDNTGVKFKLYSEYPFEPKSNRTLTTTQKEVLSFIKKDGNDIWVKRDTIDGKPVLRVAVPDYMTQEGCVKCHNSHKDKTWDFDWKLGDKRGVLEVITPLDKDLAANNAMRNNIILFVSGAMLLLVIYYSITLIRRETQLLDANEILEQRVKEEVEKNISQQKQMTQQSRSAAMGDMMGAIIHQWKQPLNGISIASSAIDMQVLMDDFDKELITSNTKSIANQIENMNTTMNDFRNFFKPQSESCYEISSCINDVNKMIGTVFAINKVNIKPDINDSVITSGYPNELNQVIINILNNARDIIEETKCEIRDVFVKTFVEDGKAIITITDCAGGVPEDIIDNIFDPYVTTKSDDKGTGIGLDMSKTIIEKVNGNISVSNVITNIEGKEYKGAQFRIELNSCK